MWQTRGPNMGSGPGTCRNSRPDATGQRGWPRSRERSQQAAQEGPQHDFCTSEILCMLQTDTPYFTKTCNKCGLAGTVRREAAPWLSMCSFNRTTWSSSPASWPTRPGPELSSGLQRWGLAASLRSASPGTPAAASAGPPAPLALFLESSSAL